MAKKKPYKMVDNHSSQVTIIIPYCGINPSDYSTYTSNTSTITGSFNNFIVPKSKKRKGGKH